MQDGITEKHFGCGEKETDKSLKLNAIAPIICEADDFWNFWAKLNAMVPIQLYNDLTYSR